MEEYLTMSFSPDREYLDGEIRERIAGEYPHSKVQRRLMALFEQMARSRSLHPAPELRIQVTPTRYRVADLAVFAGEEPAENVPSRPPLVIVEILSRDDRWVEVVEKLEDYRQWGVRHIWLVDPWLHKLSVYSQEGIRQTEALEIPELEARLTAAEIVGGSAAVLKAAAGRTPLLA